MIEVRYDDAYIAIEAAYRQALDMEAVVRAGR